jgi:hypothetical protein
MIDLLKSGRSYHRLRPQVRRNRFRLQNGIGRFSLSAEALTARARQIAGRELPDAERSLYIDEPSA